ncbi:DUF4349 domain-containing protein [Oscillochloris sp. ZM17-4]|uniref:DUF4349 domain-containing protein n=1 Tax=Oscillochloris sp. ZM17-4 TaxID=2866714 RepID=UPI001C733CC1|nr:DUF4349 domain-containing protein [Oscillochloris sp. ZM17-4]MBX0328989.1 DUF4349 domain-containing protein [Oscillochloris sp. ZM17-4]
MQAMKILAAAMLAAMLLAACGGAQSASAPMPSEPEMAMATAAPIAAGAPAALESYDSAAGGAAQSAPASQAAAQRMVIKTASISLQVAKVPDAEASIRARAEQLGGYVVSVQTNGSGDRQTSTITFRVPSDSFGAALADLEGLASKVLSRSVGGDDVTAEFVDLDSRLRNLEATRTRLLDLLAKATKVEDALQVNNALTDIQGQIEQIQGRMKYLKDSAAMATITADLQPVPPQPSIIPESGWQPLRVARQALGDLLEFGQGLAELGIVLLIWSPVWLPLLLLGRWGWRRATRGRRKAPAA